MQDEPLMSVTRILDDSTGIYADDLCDMTIHLTKLTDFLKAYGTEGAKAIYSTLDRLKRETEYYLNEVEQG